MNTETDNVDQPPSYDASTAAPSYDDSTAAPQQHDPTLLQEPMTLFLDGQSIRGGQSADAPALYETDRGVANLGHATTTVELTRIERTVQSTTTTAQTLTGDDTKAALGEADEKEAGKGPASSDAAAPRIKLRRRHIFNLVHPTGTTTAAAEAAVGYYMKPLTKTTHAGTYGLKKKSHTLRADEWKVLPVREKAKDGEPRFEDKGRPLFQVAKGKSGGAYEWMDADGVVLAVDEDDAEDEEGGRMRLRTVKRMESSVVDALVAMWCCWIWAEAAEAQPQVHEGGMEKVRRRLRLSKELPSSTRGNIIGAVGAF